MNSVRSSKRGLVEVALLLPLFLVLAGGSYICFRAYSLNSIAESSAHTESIRTGRRLARIERRMSEDILPSGAGVTIRSDNSGVSRLLPPPFQALAGRTNGIVEIHKGWDEIAFGSSFPALKVVRTSEGSVDCWDKQSVSGKKIRRVVDGFVAAGILR
jgi:hypothetical protein